MPRVDAVELKRQGLSYSEIGSLLGVNRQRAQHLVKPSGKVCAAVRRIADGMCQSCFEPLEAGHIHHRTTNCPSDVYNTARNLLYVCQPCHGSLESNTFVVLD